MPIKAGSKWRSLRVLTRLLSRCHVSAGFHLDNESIGRCSDNDCFCFELLTDSRRSRRSSICSAVRRLTWSETPCATFRQLRGRRVRRVHQLAIDQPRMRNRKGFDLAPEHHFAKGRKRMMGPVWSGSKRSCLCASGEGQLK